MPATPTYANRIINLMRGGASIAAWTPWITIYLGNPLEGGAELADPSHARQQVTLNDPVADPQGQSSNTTAITFPVLAVDMELPARYFGILTASSGGELRYVHPVPGTDAERTLPAGRQFIIPAGGLTLVVGPAELPQDDEE